MAAADTPPSMEAVIAMTSDSSWRMEGQTSVCRGLVWLKVPYASSSRSRCSLPAMYKAPDTLLLPSVICRFLDAYTDSQSG